MATITAPSTLRLSELARHLVIPDGVVRTAWPRIKRRLASMGIVYDAWQEQAAQVALGLRANGRYAATVGGNVWSIPRQVGKTFTVGSLLIALCIEFPLLRVVWTSHHLRTTTNTFRSMQGMVRRETVWPHVEQPNGIRTANGEQEIRFGNGSIVMFGAREQGFGRGIDAVDVLVFDEAQILGEKALEDMVATTNQARHEHGALLFYIGTPPRPVDDGEAFTNKRDKALSGKSSDQMYLEFSADADADPDDRGQWARANPSFPSRTPLESMLRMRENLPSDDAWLREALGVWDPVKTLGVIPMQLFTECGDVESVPVDRLALGVEVGPDLRWASVILAGQRDDGLWHFEVDEDQYTKGQGVAWLEPHLQTLLANNPHVRAVAVDVASPIKALLEKHGGGWRFRDSKIPVEAITVQDLGATTALFLNRVVTGGIRYIPATQVAASAAVAGKRPLGDTGMWVFSRKSAESDITQIQGAVLGLWAAEKTKVRRSPTGRSRRSSRREGAIVL